MDDKEADEIKSDWEDVTGVDVPRMTTDELTQFVLNYCDGHLFTSADIRPSGESLIGTIFMPLAFGAFGDRSKSYFEKIGIIWEHISAAGPRSINGYPMFMSMRIMHKDDWTRAHAAIRTELDRRKNIKV